MSIEQMRGMLIHKTKYKNSWKWINRVRAMSDAQVIAIYMRMMRSKEFIV